MSKEKSKEKSTKVGDRKSGGTDLAASLSALENIGSSSWFRPKAGPNAVRIMPAFHSKGPFRGLFFNHLRKHTGIQIEGKNATIFCTKNWSDEPCPVCEFMGHLTMSGNKKDEQLAKKIRPQDQFFVNLLDRTDGKVKKYGMKKSMMKSIRGYLLDPDYGDITDSKNGRDIKITKEGEGTETRY